MISFFCYVGLLAVFSVVGCTPQRPLDSGSTARETASLIVKTDHFAFHSDPWINLHHFLFQWAREKSTVNDRRPTVVVREREQLATLSEADRLEWQQAVAFYTEHLIDKDLLFDRGLSRLRRGLFAGNLSDADFPGFSATLRGAMTIYKRSWWKTHDQTNRAWTQGLHEKLERFESRLSRELADSYGGTWPSHAVRVDVSAYANWAGAYTSNRPHHITISSTDREYQDFGALEIVFHEASHLNTLQGSLTEALGATYERLGEAPPRHLWHVVIFYTAGELTRRIAVEVGDSYVPVAHRTGLYDRVRGGRGYKHALEKHWQQFLDGKVERHAALAGVAAEARN